MSQHGDYTRNVLHAVSCFTWFHGVDLEKTCLPQAAKPQAYYGRTGPPGPATPFLQSILARYFTKVSFLPLSAERRSV